MSVEVPAASFRPEEVKEEASEDVERLTSIGETAHVVALEVRGAIFLFEDRFFQEDERPGAEWCRVYYMGEGGGFPQVQVMVSVVSPRLPVACPM